MRSRTIQAFQKKVYDHYRVHGRNYPWRQTTSPYRIVVSEIMLQQTQADRVVPKYRAFLRMFPTAAALARAPLSEVLRAWQGLGYNRRARMLHRCAQQVVTEYRGTFPRSYEALRALPGIGPYTAGAVLAFAFNDAVPIIETNIRTVYLHEFFPGESGIRDRELMPYIEATLDRAHPREWYAALMSYGVHLKKTAGNASVRSRHYARQTPFRGSDRQVRGAIIRALAGAASLPKRAVVRAVSAQVEVPPERVEAQLAALVREGLVVCRARRCALAA